MTLVQFETAGSGYITGTPTNPAKAKVFRVPVPSSGNVSVEVSPTGEGWAWKLDYQVTGVTAWTDHVLVPDVETLPGGQLVKVNPATLEPIYNPENAWWATLAAGLAAAKGEDGEPGKAGDPGKRGDPGRDGANVIPTGLAVAQEIANPNSPAREHMTAFVDGRTADTVPPMVPPLVAAAIAADATIVESAEIAVASAAEGMDLVVDGDERLPLTTNNAMEDVLGGFADMNGLMTWLSARPSDGGPTEWAMDMIRARMNYLMRDATDILFTVTDSADLMTDLTVRGSDGQVPDWVIDRWASRLTGKVGSATAQLSKDDRYVTATGELLPVAADVDKIVLTGSSSMQGAQSLMAAALLEYNPDATVLQEGKGGEVSQHIAARLGSIPALVTVTGGVVPASGAVNITVSNMPLNGSLKPYAGNLNGVHGTLSFSTNVYIFTRTTPGETVNVTPGTPFIPDLAAQSRAGVGVLWMGKNDFNTAVPNAEIGTIQRTDTTHDWFTSFIKRVIVMGHFVDGGTPEVSEERRQIYACNAAHAERYGKAFIDVHSFLTTQAIWDATSLTPTQADLDAQAIGNKPPSVSADNGHLNATGYAALVNHLIKPKLTELNWF